MSLLNVDRLSVTRTLGAVLEVNLKKKPGVLQVDLRT